ncbi:MULTISPECIES: hypothetical protein [unclassified Streptomyces]|uniref:hypothetical protein n=1 Tax=unclassified Streptomyces TaxID=2593676 RepID=UPI0036E3B394
MIRRETFCDGRLVKEIDQVDVSTRSLREQFIDGSWRWLLDGEEVQDVEAEAFRTVWDAQH